MDAQNLLYRLLDLVGGSRDYFVSGSLSFLPRLDAYRAPLHDVDVALSERLFAAARAKLRPDENLRFLRLGQVALAEDFLPRAFQGPRTGFVHLTTPAGLLDLAVYGEDDGLDFSLGAGLALHLPRVVLDRVVPLEWEGCRYRAGPIELAFIPKAVRYLRRQRSRKRPAEDERKHLEDLARLAPLVDWTLLEQLVKQGGVCWFGGQVAAAALRSF